MKNKLLLISLIVALCAGILSTGMPQASAAPHTTAPARIFERTSFVIHMGLAFYAFHHYVLSAERSGEFRSGAAHRKLNLAKAAVALLFTFHELDSARKVANRSSSKSLHALAAPLNGLASLTNRVYSRFNRGNFSPADLTGLNGAVSSFGSRAAAAGLAIRDRHITVPGA